MFKFTKNKNYILAILLLILIFILIFKNDNNNIIIENFDDDDESSLKVPCKQIKKNEQSNSSNKHKAINSIQNSLISIQQNNKCMGTNKESTDKNIKLLEDRNSKKK